MNLRIDIELNPNKLGGKPVLSGTRFPLSKFLAEIHDGMTPEEIVEEYNLGYAIIVNHCLSGVEVLHSSLKY